MFGICFFFLKSGQTVGISISVSSLFMLYLHVGCLCRTFSKILFVVILFSVGLLKTVRTKQTSSEVQSPVQDSNLADSCLFRYYFLAWLSFPLQVIRSSSHFRWIVLRFVRILKNTYSVEYLQYEYSVQIRLMSA